MFTDRQIASLVFRLQRPESAEADLALLSKKCPDLDVAAYRISPRRNQAAILRRLLTVSTPDEIEKNRTAPAPQPFNGSAAPVLAASAASPQKKEPAKKKSSPKKRSTPASGGKTSTTATPGSQPSSTTTE